MVSQVCAAPPITSFVPSVILIDDFFEGEPESFKVPTTFTSLYPAIAGKPNELPFAIIRYAEVGTVPPQ